MSFSYNVQGSTTTVKLGDIQFYFLTTGTGTTETYIDTSTSSITYNGGALYTIRYLGAGTISNNFGTSSYNNNFISNTGSFLSSQGLGFMSIPNDITYNIYTPDNGTTYYMYNSTDASSSILNLTVVNSCVLDNTKILTDTGIKIIKDIEIGDFIVSNNINLKVKRILKSCCVNNNLPYIIPKGELNSFEDLYLTNGHAILAFKNWFSPSQLGYKQSTLEDMKNLGYDITPLKEDPNTYPGIKFWHLELEMPETDKNSRRKYYLNANGVIIESYSTELL